MRYSLLNVELPFCRTRSIKRTGPLKIFSGITKSILMKKKKQQLNSNHWGIRLKGVMDDKSVTLREVSRICDVSPSVVSGWINNGNSPTDLISIKKLSEKLEVSFSWLLTGAYEDGKTQPSIAEIFDETPYFDGYARIRIDRLISKKGK